VPGRLFFKRHLAKYAGSGTVCRNCRALFLPLEAIVSSAFGLVLGMAGHAVGWRSREAAPKRFQRRWQIICEVSAGKSRRTGRSTVSLMRPGRGPSCLNVSVWEFVRIAGMSVAVTFIASVWKNFRHAPGVFKIDYALGARSMEIRRMQRPAQSIWAAHSMKSRWLNAMLPAEKFRRARLCWLRNRVCSTHTRAGRQTYALGLCARAVWMQQRHVGADRSANRTIRTWFS